MNEQNKIIETSFGHTSFQNLADMIKDRNEKNINLTAIGGVANIAKIISQQLKTYEKASNIFENNLSTLFSGQSFYEQNYNFDGLKGFASSLNQIEKINTQISEKLSGLASSQLSFSTNISEIAKTIPHSHLQKFDSIGTALQGISNTFLNNITKTRNWYDLNIVEEANEAISLRTENLVNNTHEITLNDLDELKKSIIIDLNNLLYKTKTEKAKLFILELITIIGFLITLYTTYNQNNDLTNEDLILETKNEIQKVNEELSNKIDFLLQKLNKRRIATTNVNLRFSNKKKSKIIGVVKIGQEISVIEIRHKYLLISYIDMETGEPKSGFVIKKYFKEIE